MEPPHTLIGFDIRELGKIGCNADLAEEAADTPFRPTANDAVPWLTFDKYVNPSVFIDKAGFDAAKHSARISVPEQTNAGFDLFRLWDDLMSMLAHYPKQELAKDAVFAYATVDLDAYGWPLPNDATINILTSRKITPMHIAADWRLLGYDIVSAYFISALSGYRHKDSDRAFIQKMKANLNRFGLIKSNTKPTELVDLIQTTNAEIDEDPFFPVALYLAHTSDASIKKHHLSDA